MANMPIKNISILLESAHPRIQDGHQRVIINPLGFQLKWICNLSIDLKNYVIKSTRPQAIRLVSKYILCYQECFKYFVENFINITGKNA